jgi:hypothetical protein
VRKGGIVAMCACAPLLAACGGGQRQDANEPHANFPVSVTTARFPGRQTLSQHSRMVISVRNAGTKTIPDIAVTVLNSPEGTAAQAFGTDISGSREETLASHSRPVWIIDRPPGPCKYSCQQGGMGSAVTAYDNTWAMGPLAPGHTATFAWGVTAVRPGHYRILYQVAAGLNGRAKATDAGGRPPQGTFSVTVSETPQQSYVSNGGQIVTVK